MSRVPFSQVLKNAKVDLRKEYDRLFELFYINSFSFHPTNPFTISDFCTDNFMSIPFRGTCISLEDFEETHGFRFDEYPSPFDIDYLISFCEYSFNVASSCVSNYEGLGSATIRSIVQSYLQHVMNVIEKIGYMANKSGGIIDFVPKDQAAISVAEIIDSSLSYRVIEYNHHSMKGDMERKKAILIALADKLEPLRDKLRQINASLEDKLFFLFNNVNIRHNNSDLNGKKFIRYVASMSGNDIEKWYDETYQLCLLAFLELDNVERKARVDQLKKDIEANK